MKKVIISFGILLGLLNAYAFASNYFQQGVASFNNKNYEAASSSFFYAIKENPYDINARYYYAVCFARMGNNTKAVSEFKTIIKMDPDSQAATMAKQALVTMDPSGSSSRQSSSSLNTYDSYISNAVTSDGLYVRWDRTRPIRVYVSSSLADLQNAEEVKRAVSAWAKALSGTARIELVENQNYANIVILFSDKTYEVSKSHHTVGTTKPSFLDGKLHTAQIILSSKDPRGAAYSHISVYNTALHEMGHALGIWGHSPYQSDVMYPFQGGNTRQVLSGRDIRTIKLLYQNPANITNTSNSATSAAVDANKKRFNSKLEEALSYVRENPTSVNANLHLASTYMGLKDYDNAIIVYKKIATMTPKDDRVYYTIGYLYETKKDFYNAAYYYRGAVNLNPQKVEYTIYLARLCINYAKYSEAQAALSNLYRVNPLSRMDSRISNLQKIIDFRTKK